MWKIPVEAIAAARKELCRRWDALKSKEIRTQADALEIIAEIQKIREGLDALAGKEEEITAQVSWLIDGFWSVRQSLGQTGQLAEGERRRIEEQFVQLLTDSAAEVSVSQGPPGDPADSPATPSDPPRQAELGRGAPVLPVLRCPFCGGSRFERGKDIHAGREPALYCRRSPRPGHRPNPELCPRLRGSVCLTCGYVLTMVDLAELYAHLAKPSAQAEGAPPRPDEQAAAENLNGAQSVEEALRRLSSGPEEPPGATGTADLPPGAPEDQGHDT